MRIHRRAVLGSMGVSITLPLLDADRLLASPTDLPNQAAPMRMVCVANPLGYVPDAFFPKEEGSNYQSTELLSVLPKERFTVFSHLDHGVTGGHRAVHAFLSGIRNNESSQFASKNISIDQLAAEHVGSETRFSSIVASVGPGEGELAGQCSWTRNGVNVPPIHDERKLFRALFVGTPINHLARERESNRRSTSVLDCVLEQAKLMQRELGARDREKIEEYFSSVRSVEERLQMSAAWIDRPKPKVNLEIDGGRRDFTERLPLFYDLITLALQTDSTRVATLAIPGQLPVGDLGLSGSYHAFSHHGKNESLRGSLVKIEKLQLQQLARFIKKLSQIAQPDGRSLLDCTMVLSGSGMGNGSSHSNKDLPILLAGGGFKHGSHMMLPEASHQRVPLCNLFLSMLQRFGVQTESFNRSTGTLSGFEVA